MATLVGRTLELGIVDDLLGPLLGEGRGAMLQLAGEAGIGKTRLLAELAARGGHLGHLVLEGRAAEFETELPFGVFVDAMDDYLAGLTPEHLEVLGGRAVSELAIFPAFDSLPSERARVLTEERYRRYRAVRSLLSRLGESQPVVLVLDDVHWADPASVELLSHLLAHPPLGPVLLVIALRPAQVPAGLKQALADAARRPGVWRLDLVPLTPAAADELLGLTMAAAERQELYRASGGNPLFLQELARGAARLAQQPKGPVSASIGVPGAVAAALASELTSVSAPARALLQGAAVAGDPFDDMSAAEAADIGADETLAALDELLARELIRTTAVSGRFAFRHPIVRAAVYESSGRTWQFRAHGRLAAALGKRGAAAIARANHVERSAQIGDNDAAAVLIEAGQSVARAHRGRPRTGSRRHFESCPRPTRPPFSVCWCSPTGPKPWGPPRS